MNSKERIWLSPPHVGNEERAYVKQAFDSNWIAPLGPNVDLFEKEIQDYCGVRASSALSSGTGAIHLALRLLGIQRGDHILCQSFTFIGTINPVLYEGAIPVFIDSERDTWNMDPDLLEEAIISLRKKNQPIGAILPVHLYGMPAKMDEINAIAARYEIPVIEDAAEALGSIYKGRKCGSLSKLGVLSFNGNKIITTSGGGALLSDDEAMIAKSRYLSTQARQPVEHYEHVDVGYNYRMSNVLAGIGIGQIRSIETYVEKRRSNFKKYNDFFKGQSGMPDVTFQPEDESSRSNRWLTCLIFKEEESGWTPKKVIETFKGENIESRSLWKPMHQQPIFQGCKSFENGTADYLFQRGLCLPSGSSLTEEDFERVFDAFLKV